MISLRNIASATLPPSQASQRLLPGHQASRSNKGQRLRKLIAALFIGTQFRAAGRHPALWDHAFDTGANTSHLNPATHAGGTRFTHRNADLGLISMFGQTRAPTKMGIYMPDIVRLQRGSFYGVFRHLTVHLVQHDIGWRSQRKP